MAEEWRAQGDEVDSSALPLRDLADYAIDHVQADRTTAIGKLIAYGETDTLCYRADPDEPLYRRQQELWEPLVAAFTANSAGTVRLGLIAAGFGMGPIFPTSVGLASVMMPRIAGTAMSLVMGIGFAGLLLIPPAVGYVSSAAGGAAGDVRTGLVAVMAASSVMLILHILLTLRERRRSTVSEEEPETSAPIGSEYSQL